MLPKIVPRRPCSTTGYVAQDLFHHWFTHGAGFPSFFFGPPRRRVLWPKGGLKSNANGLSHDEFASPSLWGRFGGARKAAFKRRKGVEQPASSTSRGLPSVGPGPTGGAKVRRRSDDRWAAEGSEGPIGAAPRGPETPFPPPRRGRPGPVGPTALAKCNFPSAKSRSVTFSGKNEGLYRLKGLIPGGARSRARCLPGLALAAIARSEVRPRPTDLARF